MPKFRVTGSNKDTSARMTIELVAASKGDAERKAAHAGMNVSHIAPINENTLEESKPPMAMKNYRDEDSGSGRQTKMLILLGVLAVVAIIIYGVLGWRPW